MSRTTADVENNYRHAVDLFERKEYGRAQAVFEQVWMAAGAFRETAQYLDRIEAALSGAPSGRDSATTAALGSQGGQVAPAPPSGGLSSGEQVSRFVLQGRQAFDDRKYDEAAARFEKALEIDGSNAEARKYLDEIDRLQGSVRLNPSAQAADLGGRAPSSGRDRSDVGEDELLAETVESLSTLPKPRNSDKPAAQKALTQTIERAPVKRLSGSAQDSFAAAPKLVASVAPSAGTVAAQVFGKAPKVESVAAVPSPAAPKPVAAPVAAASKPVAPPTAAEVKSPATKVAATEPASSPEPKGEAAKLAGEASLALSANPAAAKPVQSAKPHAEKQVSKSQLGGALDAIKAFSESAAQKSERVVAAVSTGVGKTGESAVSAVSDAVKESRKRATDMTNQGIKLFNDGKYEESIDAFSKALVEDPTNSEAAAYKTKAVTRQEARRAKETGKKSNESSKIEKVLAQAAADKKPDAGKSTLPELPTLDALKDTTKKSDTPGAKPDEKKTDVKDKADTGKKKEKDEAPDKADVKAAKADAKKDDAKAKAEKTSEDAKTAKTDKISDDPQVEADRLVRQAQRELKDGKKEAALMTARKAAQLDAGNVEAKSLVDEIEKKTTAAKPSSLPPLSAATGIVEKPAADASAAASPVAAAAAPVPPVGADGLIAEGKRKFEAGQMEEALSAFNAALEIDAANEVAARYVNQIKEAGRVQDDGRGQAVAAYESDQAEAAFQKGLVAYEAGRLDVAVQWWNYVLTLNPDHARSIEYLQQTRPEYDAWVQQHQYNAVQLQQEVAATEKLDTAVTYDTAGPKSIVEFLSAMSLITDVSFYVADGVDPQIQVTAKFEETPLQDALDIVLLPIGLKWSRSGEVVSITPDLRTKFFNLSPEQVVRLKTLLENKTLQRILYGPEGEPPMRNVELTLDDRENILLVTDSQENIGKVEAFLKEMQLSSPPGLVYKSWKVRPEEGQKIKALVEAIVKVQSDAPYDLERKVVVDGEDLIVKDSADNVAKIEQLLLDKNFIRKLETQKLGVASFNLTPREPIQDNIEQVRDLAQNIVTVVKTILYSQSTESAAAAEGRRYWYDPNTLQLTITDYPENLRVVSDYIRSLPIYGRKLKSEIVFLKHQTASDLNSLLQRVLGLAEAPAGGGTETGMSVTRTLRVEGELSFRDMRIRVTRVNENDAADDNDDSVEMVIRTPTNSEDRTIEEFRSEFIDAYELNVIEVRPSGTAGEGSARIEVRYNPAATGQTTVQPVMPGMPGTPGAPGQTGEAAETATEDVGIQIDEVENMNALLIRYDDPGDLAEVKSWIEQLDIPVLQVSIETKLVEVNEARVKEFMPEFNILNLTKGGPDLGNIVESGMDFATDASEVRNVYDPFAEIGARTGLLKGTTVFNLVTGGESPMNFTLRALETEGVLSVVNGPHVLVENGETADFQIERRYNGLAPLNQTTTNNTTNVGAVSLQNVNMSVTPKITQLGEIRLEIQDLELQDIGDQSTARTINTTNIGNEEVETNTTFESTANFNLRRRTLQTVARVHNGGTIVLGGWTGEYTYNLDSGIPVLRNIPYVGKLFFGRTSDRTEKTNLLIFLTCHLVQP